MWGDNWVEADGVGSERIHLRQNKGDRGFLNTLQGLRGCLPRGSGWALLLKGEGEEVRQMYGTLPLSVTVPGCQ